MVEVHSWRQSVNVEVQIFYSGPTSSLLSLCFLHLVEDETFQLHAPPTFCHTPLLLEL